MKKFLLLIICLLLCGCTYNSNINNLAIINEIAIDYDEDYKLYLKVLSDKENTIYIETGKTLEACFSKVSNKLTKKMYLAHLDLLILSNNLEKVQYDEVFNYFLNNDSSRNTFTTIIVDKIDENFINIDSKDIENLIDLSIDTNGLVVNKTLDMIIKEVVELNISYIPYIDTKDNKLTGYKTIYDEDKLLNSDESIIINFINNNINKITLLIDDKTYEIDNCHTSNIIKDNTIKVSITCDCNKDNKLVEDHIKDMFNNFTTNNKLNLFYYLLHKHNKNYIDINIEPVIRINYINKSTGDYFG